MMSASESTPTLSSWLVFNPSLDALHGTAPRTWSVHTAAVVAKLREFAPYAAIELVMPGGSLMALVLLLYRRQKRASLLEAQ
jgi:hypothetical protein